MTAGFMPCNPELQIPWPDGGPCGVQVAQLTPQQILAHISSMTPAQVSTMLPLPVLPRDEALLRLTTQVGCRYAV